MTEQSSPLRITAVLTFVLLAASFHAPAQTCTPPLRSPDANRSGDVQHVRPNFTRKGAEIPNYVVVREFFHFALRCYEGTNWADLLKRLQIAPGSPSAELFEQTMLEFAAIHAEGIDARTRTTRRRTAPSSSSSRAPKS